MESRHCTTCTCNNTVFLCATAEVCAFFLYIYTSLQRVKSFCLVCHGYKALLHQILLFKPAWSLISPLSSSSRFLPLSPYSQRSVMRAMSQRRRKLSNSSKKKQRQHRKLLTVSAHFRESLHLLMERLFAASPHFVRSVAIHFKSITLDIHVGSSPTWVQPFL